MERLAAILGACMLTLALLLPGTALAEDIVIDQGSDSKSATVDVSYDVAETYQLSIPATVDLSEGTQSARITATSMNIAPSRRLDVTVASGVSGGQITLIHSKDASRTTATTVSLSSGGPGISDHAVVASFAGMSTTPVSAGTLYFSALPADTRPGTYTGTITFSMAITDQ